METTGEHRRLCGVRLSACSPAARKIVDRRGASEGIQICRKEMHVIVRIWEAILARLPAALAGVLDHVRPSKRQSWGGPFNGQAGRQRLMAEILKRLDFSLVVETGTFHGTSTRALLDLSEPTTEIVSVEIDRRHHVYSWLRFLGSTRCTLVYGDSVDVLRMLLKDTSRTRVPTLFYLDAHWGSEVPLVQEVRIITYGWSDFVVIIDDFRVPHDPGYGFDSYPGFGDLSLDAIPEDVLADVQTFWPSISSADETGARRGSVILAAGRFCDALADLDSVTSADQRRTDQGDQA